MKTSPVTVYGDQTYFQSLYEVIGYDMKMPNDVMLFVGTRKSPKLTSNLYLKESFNCAREKLYLDLLYRKNVQNCAQIPYSALFDQIHASQDGCFYKKAMRSCDRAVPNRAFDYIWPNLEQYVLSENNGVLTFEFLSRFPRKDMFCVFRGLQNSLANMHDNVVCGRSTEKTPTMRVSKIRQTLCHNSVFWYKLWGELDLHRLSIRESMALINTSILADRWKRVRIVFGRGKRSAGALHQLIHAIFSEQVSDNTNEYKLDGRSSYTELICATSVEQMRKEVERKNISCAFYADGAAVELFKNYA